MWTSKNASSFTHYIKIKVIEQKNKNIPSMKIPGIAPLSGNRL